MPSERRSDSDLMQLVEPGFNNPRVAARGLPQPAVLTAALARPSTTVFTHPAKTALRTTKRPYSRAFLKYRYRDSNRVTAVRGRLRVRHRPSKSCIHAIFQILGGH